MDAALVGALAAVAVSFASGFGAALLTTPISYWNATRDRNQRALEWMIQGSQRRNVGIAVIEASWTGWLHRGYRRTVTPILCGSAVYLLQGSGQKTAAHEINNLERIMRLLLANPDRSRFPDHYSAVLLAVDSRVRGERDDEKGLDLSPERLKDWQRRLNPDPPSPSV